jgi:iron-sulfur cluster repair protein YtfE (RIC family)
MDAKTPSERDRSPIEQLQQEHQAALGAFDALTDQVAAVTAGATAWEDVSEHIEPRFHALHQLLLVHFRKEEEGLFAEAVELAAEESSEAGLIAGFFAEEADDDILAHTTLRIQMREMAALLPGIRETDGAGHHTPGELHDALLFSRDLLRRHARKEETVIFPLIQRLLTEEQMMAVRRRIAEIIPSA